jgi:hypothetical protein
MTRRELRWPDVVVSGWAAERAPEAWFFIFVFLNRELLLMYLGNTTGIALLTLATPIVHIISMHKYQPRMLGNGSDHVTGLGVGCGGRKLWLMVGPLSERRGRAAAAIRAICARKVHNL